jgi:hypothetical protein
MFHFPAFPPLALCVQARVTGHDSSRVSPFGNPRINARLAAPRGLSQPPTSFIGSWCQGIHRAPLLAWPQRCSRPLCSSQGAGGPDRGVRRRPRPVQRRSVRYDARRSSRGKAPNQSRPAGASPGLSQQVLPKQEPVPSGPNNVPGRTHPRRHRSCLGPVKGLSSRGRGCTR